MKARHTSRLYSLLVFAIIMLVPVCCSAQCYLSQGCAPQDDLTYIPNGTGQVYHGDGASNNGAGGWTTNYSDVNQCLSCHYGTDTAYLMTGHKNTLRKLAPTVLWNGPDGSAYPSSDSFYNSGSTFSWSNNLVTLGWCSPAGTQAKNGLPMVDPLCQYPYYTLPNSHAPAPYTPVGQTQAAGGVRNMYYLYGGWQHYGGTGNPAATQLNVVFDKGFVGDLYPNGNFDCARCHATGYNFDNWGPEPTSNTGGKLAWIPDASLSRLPSDGYIAPGTNGTSSWYLTGIQCERCHVAAYGYGSHPWDNVTVTIAQNEAATALCMECHRQETIAKANPATNFAGSITPASPMQTKDLGYCSDLSGSSYANCVVNPANAWVYKPYVDHEAGQAFLNGPHARFQGNIVQNAQHSSDLSITLAGTYGSAFSENLNDPTKNLGCTGCHDPHQSTVAAVTSPVQKPIVQTCDQCHALAKTILQTTIHPAGPGTPFPTGTQADIPGACITCHMQAALGTPESHLFRISADANYFTYPTPDQLYNQGITTLGVEAEYSPINGTTFNNASWLDVDLACGQCHVGGDGVTNPYGLTYPPGMPGSHAYTRQQLAYWASVMHAPDPGVPNPTFSPQPGTFTAPVSVKISDSMTGAIIYYTTDGSLPTNSSPTYSAPFTLTSSTTVRAMARYPGMPGSSIVSATYSINLPTAPPPLFSPSPTTYSSPVNVTLSNTPNLPMYYTTDNSTPTTNSTPYAGQIALSKNTTIKAITAGYGYLTSSVATGNYYFTAPTPTITPGSETISASTPVTISDSAVGATIYYTTNGNIPTTSSMSCGNPCGITILTTTTVKAIASGGGYVAGNVATATYTFTAANPVFNPTGNTFTAPVTVTITESTPGATIYYSTTGFPTTSSPSCSSPCNVTISTTATLRAMATGTGISQSGTTAATYTIVAATPVISPSPGSYAAPLSVTITDSSPGVLIYYAINGFPTTSSTSCSSPCTFSLPATAVVRAMATGGAYSQSNTATASYTLH